MLALRTGWTLEYIDSLGVDETLDMFYVMEALEKAYGD